MIECDLPDCHDPHCPMCGHPLDCSPGCVKQEEECPWNSRAPRNLYMEGKITAEELEDLLVL